MLYELPSSSSSLFDTWNEKQHLFCLGMLQPLGIDIESSWDRKAAAIAVERKCGGYPSVKFKLTLNAVGVIYFVKGRMGIGQIIKVMPYLPAMPLSGNMYVLLDPSVLEQSGSL